MSFYDQIRYEEEGEARFCVQAAMWFGVFACLTVLSSLITGGLYLWKGWYPWLLLPLARLPLVYLTYRIWIRPKEQSLSLIHIYRPLPSNFSNSSLSQSRGTQIPE